MEQNNPNRTYAALGIAGQAGCLTVILAVGALLVGLWLDQILGTRRIFALVCIVVSVPINLFVTLRLTQRLIARIVPPDKPKSGFSPANDKAEPPNDDD
jgi:hypothetical protein